MFRSARLKLTAWYLLIIMLISIVFSGVIYRMLVSEVQRFDTAQRVWVQRRIESQEDGTFRLSPPVVVSTTDLVAETEHRILVFLIVVNGAIFFVAGGLGYFLAGLTLTPIQDMMDEQNRFISDASHELRTPLTSLKSAFEVYLRDRRPTLSEAKELITDSITEVNKLQSLSDSLLQLAQYEKPNAGQKFSSFDVSVVIQRAIHKMEPIAMTKKISMRYSPVAILIEADAYGLEDALVILLDNAMKYSHEGQRVDIMSEQDDGSVTIRVQDHGVGIASEDIPHLFDRFYRADAARSKHGVTGYGLGLSIAQKIVKAHHGSIRVTSALGRGSVFIIRLPVSQSRSLRKLHLFR